MNNNILSVSFIIPVYNSENTLEVTVKSIMSSTYSDFEIILVDDGSEDKTWNICQSMQAKYNNVRAFHQANSGASSARNYGIRVAAKKFITFVDSDDLICSWEMPDFVAKSDPDVIIGGVRVIEKTHEEVNRLTTRVVTSRRDKREIVSLLIQHNLFNSLCNKFYLRSKITKLISEDIRIGEDFLFNVDFFEQSLRFALVSEVVYEYHLRPDSVTHSFNPQYLSEINTVDAVRLELLGVLDDSSWSDRLYLSDLYSLMSLISMPINMSVTQGIAISHKLSQNQYTINRLNSMKDTHIGHKFFIFRFLWLSRIIWLLIPIFRLKHLRRGHNNAN